MHAVHYRTIFMSTPNLLSSIPGAFPIDNYLLFSPDGDYIARYDHKSLLIISRCLDGVDVVEVNFGNALKADGMGPQSFFSL
jgi:hypothetical protein